MTDIEAIKKILWEDWDPIGVREMGGPPDEYDAYAPVVLEMLEAGATETEIAQYLFWLTVEQIGLETRETSIARALIKLRAN
ncbi:hypothetical protein DevBK_18635 [Devosia sp. BK]|uniref:hypothetical protein n=1 Tax=Devosia sp. BK TaxID=2871706 RepID=UPI00293A6337|nr:hypothetical protein [Devosia sp. BK]MDV3253358.1 hypothetical protein [Devosia sp. BK]